MDKINAPPLHTTPDYFLLYVDVTRPIQFFGNSTRDRRIKDGGDDIRENGRYDRSRRKS